MPSAPERFRPAGWRPPVAWEHRGKSSHQRGYGAPWRALRADILAAEPLCRMCQAEGRVTPAAELDHIVPKMMGGTDERANLQPICREHHRAKSVVEAHMVADGAIEHASVIVICGPPAAGKTTYVRDNASRGDLIVDSDALFAAVSGLQLYDKPDELKPAVWRARSALIDAAFMYRGGRAWIIDAAPTMQERRAWTQRGATVLPLVPRRDECVRRIIDDAARALRRDELVRGVDDWFTRAGALR